MVNVPEVTPDTTPVVEPTVARALLLLLHVPPPPSASVAVASMQTWVVPVIAAGNGFTVIVSVTLHPIGKSAYVIVGVPAATPPARPVEIFTVAREMLLLLHVPPLVASVSVAVVPGHRDVAPPIAAGSGFTVTVVVRMQPVDGTV